MRTESIDLGEDWTIHWSVMPCPHVHYMNAANHREQEGQRHIEGFVISEEFAGDVFSEKALACASKICGGKFYLFDEERKLIVEYELALHHKLPRVFTENNPFVIKDTDMKNFPLILVNSPRRNLLRMVRLRPCIPSLTAVLWCLRAENGIWWQQES